MNNVSLYVITVLIWGSTWIAIEFQLGVVPAEVSIFYRYSIAALLLFTWCLLKRLNLRFSIYSHVRFAALGFLLFSVNYIFAYHGQRFITSALMAIVFSSLVWMNIIHARYFFGVRSSSSVMLGALLGIVGVVVIFWPSVQTLSFSDATVLGAVLGIVGTYLASLGNMVSQAAQRKRFPVIQTNAWGMFYGAFFTGFIAWAMGREFVFDRSFNYISSLLYLAVFGSVIAFGAYLSLLGKIGAHKVGYTSILFPVVALVISYFFEDLAITLPMIIGVTLVLTGNYFVMRGEPASKCESVKEIRKTMGKKVPVLGA